MIDRLDRKILQILQEDATVPVAEIGRRIGLSTRRIATAGWCGRENSGALYYRGLLTMGAKHNLKTQLIQGSLKLLGCHSSSFPVVIQYTTLEGTIQWILASCNCCALACAPQAS